MIRFLSIFPLLALVLVAVGLPARHGWLPLWPSPLVEIVHTDESGDVRRGIFETVHGPADGRWLLRSGQSREIESMAVSNVESYDKPLSAVVVESRNGGRYFGYLAGVRDGADGELVGSASKWIDGDFVEYSDEAPPYVLVFQTLEGDSIEIAFPELLRYYRPNRMSRADKARLFVARLRAQGFDSESDA